MQGMKTAMHRTGTGGSNFTGGSGVNLDDSTLVAYWAFDEGQGYVIKDVTGHGHDLHATSIPHWQVKFYCLCLSSSEVFIEIVANAGRDISKQVVNAQP